MKRKLVICLLLLLSGCSATPLDPTKDWRISRKSPYTDYVNKLGLASFTVTDGNTSEQFDDSANKYHVGDTIGHTKVKPPTPIDSTKTDSLKVLTK